jgi:hypothetical protein
MEDTSKPAHDVKSREAFNAGGEYPAVPILQYEETWGNIWLLTISCDFFMFARVCVFPLRLRPEPTGTGIQPPTANKNKPIFLEYRDAPSLMSTPPVSLLCRGHHVGQGKHVTKNPNLPGLQGRAV